MDASDRDYKINIKDRWGVDEVPAARFESPDNFS